MRDTILDYIPLREPNVKERMKEGESLKDGLAGRVTATQRGVRHRAYRDNSGSEVPGRAWENSYNPRGDNINGD